jgi:hypothetical protein
MRLCASVIAIAVLSPLSAFAQEPPPGAPPAAPPGAPPAAPAEAAPAAPAAAPAAPAAPAAAPAAAAPKWYDLVTVDGLVDSYYQYNFSGANSLTPTIAGSAMAPSPSTVRSFDIASNAFSLNYAKIGVGIAPSPVGFRLDMGYGQTGVVVNSVSQSSIGATGTNPFLVEQAFASVVPVENFTVDFGKFDTSAGAEVIQSNKNWLYSRSILFSVIPLLHEGLRLSYVVNKQLSLQGGVVNGWNGTGVEPDFNAAKSFELQANFTAPMGLNAILTSYIGKESVTSNNLPPASPNTRVLVDLVVAHTINNIGLNLNVDYLSDKGSGFQNLIGASLMGHIPVNDHFAGNARVEYVHDTVPGATSTSFNFYEVTLGGSLPMGGHFEFRPELRYDGSNQEIFNLNQLMMTPAVVGTPKKNQFTATGAFLAYF